MTDSPNGQQPPEPEPEDSRLYVPDSDQWQAKLKATWEKEYCYAKNPGEDYFHLLMCGEIYLTQGHEKYCLNCAMRMGVVSRNRTSWQKGG